MATPKPLRIGTKIITKKKCEENYEFFNKQIPSSVLANKEYKSTLKLCKSVLTAHTFAYGYFDSNSGKKFSPLKSIFGFNETTGKFDSSCFGLQASSLRKIKAVPDLHMGTSKKLGHQSFLFSYLGVHNPYHRQHDLVPVRPFGLFLRMRGTESFPYSHAAPCDVTTENPLVDRKNLEKYYLLPADLRTLKAKEIIDDRNISDFWYYFGDPQHWKKTKGYGRNIYQKTGEFRYFEQIKPASIAAILWPLFTDIVDIDGNIDMDSNFDLMNAFRKAFPDITVITYNHDIEDSYDWALNLIEASYYSTRYFIKNKKFPKSADFAKKEILQS